MRKMVAATAGSFEKRHPKRAEEGKPDDDNGGVKSMLVREVAAAADFRNAEFPRQTGGLGQLEKRLRQDDRVCVVNCGEAARLRKPLPTPISRIDKLSARPRV